jgi:hypothetical protein
LDYISDDEQGYYDYNSKSAAAHHVIGIGLNNADPETFNHELAHHYVKMFWRSRLIQTALRAVDRPGMSDYEREEALVEFITSVTKDSVFLSQLESNSILQRFWGEFAYMIYRAFNIQSKSIINGLMQNVTKSFMLNRQLDNLRTTK